MHELEVFCPRKERKKSVVLEFVVLIPKVDADLKQGIKGFTPRLWLKEMAAECQLAKVITSVCFCRTLPRFD